MTVQNLEKELKQGNLKSIYLFYGEETYLLESAVKKIKKLFGKLILGINYILIEETNSNRLISDLETPPFGYEKKLVIVKNAQLFKKEGKDKKTKNDYSDKLADYISNNIKMMNESTVLIIIEKEISKNPLMNVLQNNGEICNFEKLKPAELKARINAICKAYKTNIDDYTLQYFIETCGTDMQKLINEIRKLIEYVGENGNIKKEDIDKLSTKELESVIFDLTDNLGKKNTKQALVVLNELLYNKEPIQKILVTLYNHFKKIYIVELARKYNKDIATNLNLKPNQTFLISKYKKQSEYFSEKELRNILQELTNLDYNCKQGNIDINVGLEAILCTYF